MTSMTSMTSITKYRSVAVIAAVVAGAALSLVGSGVVPQPSPTTIVAAQAPVTRVTVDALEAPASSALHATSSETSPGAPGYSLLQTSLVAQTPAGFRVWVDPAAPHHWAIGRNTAATVTALRGMGTNVRYLGYGRPAVGEGIVRMREGTKGCGSGDSAIGVTWTYWNTLPSGKRYVTRADVYLCPRLFRMGTWATKATVGHELGHAMGLGHVTYRYLGSYQLMNPAVRSSVLSYRAGDRRGLTRLARATVAIRAEIPPIGKLENSSYTSDGAIAFTGWALLKYYRADPVTIVLTDNGRVVRTSGTPVLRTDVNRANDPGSRTHGFSVSVPWTGGTHDYCITARSTRHPAASSQLGCVTWHD